MIALQVYLSVVPGELQEASKYGRSFAHVAYRIGPGSTLLRQNLLLQTRGGLLSISDREAPPIEEPDALCAAVLRECSRRSYGGAVLDFEDAPRRDRIVFAERLERALTTSRRALYVPENYLPSPKTAVPLICTAMSGGTFTERLQEAIRARGGAGRLALDIQRLRMDFRLPARSGEGTPLSGKALEQLMAREAPAVFFSRDLCARYFTYTEKGETHFVLFDDADTLNQKLKTGAKMGFAAAFFMWPEVRDIAEKLALR